jgi:hypothetical protein
LGYYIRVLGKNPAPIPLETLRSIAEPALLEGEDKGTDWNELVLSHKSGTEIAIIEKNLVIDGELGAEELEEFVEEISDYKPDSAARWLKSYLPTVKVIYAFQILEGTEEEDGWTLLHKIFGEIKRLAGGITQADGEGFSNEEGYTILWQFSEQVTGSWNVGVLDQNDSWVHFEIDLGDLSHREAFWRGEVPAGVKLA